MVELYKGYYIVEREGISNIVCKGHKDQKSFLERIMPETS